MKYIFTFHSNITFISALTVYKYLRLNSENTLFLSNGYKVPLKNFKYYDYYDLTEKNWLIKIKNFNYPKAFDKYIKKLTDGDEYIAYIDLMSAGNRVLITNERCKGFNFLEEGIVNYYNYNNLRLYTIDIDSFPWRINYIKDWKFIFNSIIRIIRGRSLRLLNLPVHPGAYCNFIDVKFYCFSKKANLNISEDQKIVIPFNYISAELKELTKGIDISNSLLWLGDTICKFYKIPLDIIESALRKSLANLQRNKKDFPSKIFIKFKGGQSLAERDISIKVFSEYGLKSEILPDDLVMEAVLLHSKNLIVLGNGTSLLLYANIFGHKTYSIFKNIPDNFNIPLESSFPNFWDFVEEL